VTDTISRAARSAHMARIRGRNTLPERRLRSALHAKGFRYRLNVRSLPGSPDIVLPRYRAAVFVHGCFWHRHARCKLAYTPNSNTKFWKDKFDANVDRDRRQISALNEKGWRVTVVWECKVRSAHGLTQELERLSKWIIATDRCEADPRSGCGDPTL
jgi:DNA mismatch endonuclease (patch repair protein)